MSLRAAQEKSVMVILSQVLEHGQMEGWELEAKGGVMTADGLDGRNLHLLNTQKRRTLASNSMPHLIWAIIVGDYVETLCGV